jgi:hypothetical protein
MGYLPTSLLAPAQASKSLALGMVWLSDCGRLAIMNVVWRRCIANWIRAMSVASVWLIATAWPSYAQNSSVDPLCPPPPPIKIPGIKDQPYKLPPGRTGTPLIYRDPKTGIAFYAESDGRHLAATGEDGRLLWVRDPFKEKGLCAYRTTRPVLAQIGPPDQREMIGLIRPLDARDSYIGIIFDSSQFGFVNERTGDFDFAGQN